MWTSFTPAVQIALDLAHQYAAQEENPTVEPLHVLLSLAMLTPEQAPELHAVLQAHETHTEELRLYTEAALAEPHRRSRREPHLSPMVKEALSLAIEMAQREGQASIGPEYVLLGLARIPIGSLHYQAVLVPLGLTSRPLRRTIESIERQKRPYREGNPLNDLSDASKLVLERAHELMRLSFCGRIDTPHLLLALLDESSLEEIFTAAEIDVDQLRAALNAGLSNDGEIAMPQQRFTENARRCFQWATNYAEEEDAAKIEPRHLLQGLLPQDLHSKEIHEMEAGENLIARCVTAEQAAALDAQLLAHRPKGSPESPQNEALNVKPHQQWIRMEWPYFALGVTWGPLGYLALRLHADWAWRFIVAWWIVVVLACIVVTVDASLRRWYHPFGSVLTGCLTGIAAFFSCMACFGPPK